MTHNEFLVDVKAKKKRKFLPMRDFPYSYSYCPNIIFKLTADVFSHPEDICAAQHITRGAVA